MWSSEPALTCSEALPAAPRNEPVTVCEPPGAIVADAGERARWSRAPAFTVSDAVLVLPPSFPVTVCAPATVAVHVLPVHEPSGRMVNVVAAVTSPSGLLAASNACAAYICEPPAVMLAFEGLMTMWSSGPGFTCSDAVPVLPALVPVTVCAPAPVAVHVLPVHDPSGPIENVVEAVTSPSEFPAASKPWAVKLWEPPAVIVAF